MQQSILLFLFAAIAKAYAGSEPLDVRVVLPRSPAKSRTRPPKMQLPTIAEGQIPTSSQQSNPSRTQGSNVSLVSGTVHGPGRMITNTHNDLDTSQNHLYTHVRHVKAEGFPVARVSTTSQHGSSTTASGNHGVTIVVKNEPNTHACVTCVLPDGPQHAYVGRGSQAIYKFLNPQPERGTITVGASQVGPGIITAIAYSKTSNRQNQRQGRSVPR